MVLADLAAQCFQLPTLRFAVDTFLDGASGRFGGGAFLLHGDRFCDQSLKPRKRILAVLLLGAIALRLDDDYPVAGDAPVGQLPDISGIATYALGIKMICVTLAILMLATFIWRGERWAEQRKRNMWITSSALAITALSSAAFLRWFS